MCGSIKKLCTLVNAIVLLLMSISVKIERLTFNETICCILQCDFVISMFNFLFIMESISAFKVEVKGK